MIELTFLKELRLLKQVYQKSVIFVTCWYLLNYSFRIQPNVCNRCHDLLMRSVNLIDIANLNIKSSDYRCIISLICKSKAINLMQDADLIGKSVTLQSLKVYYHVQKCLKKF